MKKEITWKTFAKNIVKLCEENEGEVEPSHPDHTVCDHTVTDSCEPVPQHPKNLKTFKSTRLKQTIAETK